MSGIAQSLLGAFGGSVNLTAVLALLGGFTGVAMVAMSPILAFFMRVKWSPQKKNIAVWVVSFIVEGVLMYAAHAFTGSLFDVGTWVAAWGALSIGATTMHDKFWGTNGSGVSTFIEKNYFPGTHVPVPTSATDVMPALKAAGKEWLETYLASKASQLEQAATHKPAYTGAGTAGAFPNPDTAPLTGGTSISVQPTTGLGSQAQAMAIDSHGSTGQSYVPDGTVLPVVAEPVFHPAPQVAAQVAAVSDAIATGKPAMEVADAYDPQAD